MITSDEWDECEVFRVRFANGEGDWIEPNTLTQATASDAGYEALMQAQTRWALDDPLIDAAKAGDVPRLEALRAAGHPWNEEVLQCASWAGQLHVLEYAQRRCLLPWSWDVIRLAAARGGHTHILEWAGREEPQAAAGEN